MAKVTASAKAKAKVPAKAPAPACSRRWSHRQARCLHCRPRRRKRTARTARTGSRRWCATNAFPYSYRNDPAMKNEHRPALQYPVPDRTSALCGATPTQACRGAAARKSSQTRVAGVCRCVSTRSSRDCRRVAAGRRAYQVSMNRALRSRASSGSCQQATPAAAPRTRWPMRSSTSAKACADVPAAAPARVPPAALRPLASRPARTSSRSASRGLR